MSVGYHGIQTIAQREPASGNADQLNLIVARQILAEVLEIIALSTTDETVQDLALDALGLDRMYEGVLADVARVHATRTEPVCEPVAAGVIRDKPMVCGPVLWIRRKDVERD